MYSGKYYFETDNFKLIYDDTLKAIKKFEDKTVDMIFADPPYFLSNNGITCSGGKMVSVNKGEWDKSLSVKEKHKFNKKWIKECYRILRDNGTIWVSGTLHNIYSIGMALEEEGFKIINNITWQKTNTPPNLACKTFTHSTETILWARKDLKKVKYTFNYEIMKQLNNNKQMKDVWTTSLTRPSEKRCGNHPTQKPLEILNRLILASTKGDDLILDPFCGSGTTMIECKLLNRRGIGIDINIDALKLAKSRLDFEYKTIYEPKLIKADSINLQNIIPNERIDFIFVHPPYANIIKYSKDIKEDISRLKLQDFLNQINLFSKECFRILKKDKICSILIGDIRKNKNVIPLGFYIMNIFIQTGFTLKEIIIKEQHNCKMTDYWKNKDMDFYLLAHEYIYVFKK